MDIRNMMLKLSKIVIPSIITALLIFSAIAAKGGLMGKWKVVMTLPKLHKAEAFWFKGDIGLVFGHYRSLEDLLNKDIAAGLEKKQAFVLRTVNNGKRWEKTYDGNGELNTVSYREQGSILYALGRKYEAGGEWRPYLVQSTNLGESWSDLKLPNGGMLGIDFSNPNVGYAWTDNTLFKTTDGTETWSKIKSPLNVTLSGPRPVVDLNGTIWTINRDKIKRIGHDESVTEIDLPNSILVDRIDIADDHSIWFVGRIEQDETKRTSVYRYKEGQIENIANLDFILPRAFYAGSDKIFLLGSDLSEVPPRKILMYSKDRGKSWRKEEPAISDAIGPVFFEGEKIIWAYGSEDRIQRRKF